MSAWVLRGLGMAVLHGAAITLLAKYAVYHPTDQTLVISIALAVLVGAAALWSALDAWRDLPERGKVWFISALIAGPVAGILYVIGRAVFVDQTGVSELGGALTGGAAFSALLVLIPAGLGLFVGGRIGGRTQPEDAESDAVEPAAASRRVRSGRAGSADAEPVVARSGRSRPDESADAPRRPRPGRGRPGDAEAETTQFSRVPADSAESGSAPRLSRLSRGRRGEASTTESGAAESAGTQASRPRPGHQGEADPSTIESGAAETADAQAGRPSRGRPGEADASTTEPGTTESANAQAGRPRPGRARLGRPQPGVAPSRRVQPPSEGPGA